MQTRVIPIVFALAAMAGCAADTEQAITAEDRSELGSGPWVHLALGEPLVNNGEAFVYDQTFMVWRQVGGLAGGSYVLWNIEVPAVGSFSHFVLNLTGGMNSGHATLPSVLPRVRLFAVATDGGPPTTVADVIDPSGDVATYDQPHIVNLGPVPVAFDPQIVWRLVVEGESGVGAAPALGILDARYQR